MNRGIHVYISNIKYHPMVLLLSGVKKPWYGTCGIILHNTDILSIYALQSRELVKAFKLSSISHSENT